MENEEKLSMKQGKKHLIKNYKIDLLKGKIIELIIIGGVLFYFFAIDSEDNVILIGSITLLFSAIRDIRTKIILGIESNSKEFTIFYYSLFKGEKTLQVRYEDLVDVDYKNDLKIKYKEYPGKAIQNFKINAEPWNNLYEQIKRFKLYSQDYKNKY